MTLTRFGELCERAYAAYHRPQFISPDPLEIVLEYQRPEDREAVALIATSVALGRVDGILRATRDVLRRIETLGASPYRALLTAGREELNALSEGFVYRFFDQFQLSGLLLALSRTFSEYGSIEELFRSLAGQSSREEAERRSIRGLEGLVRSLRHAADGALDGSILLAMPEKGSACKRLLLFLRWMVRNDQIDPGHWRALDARELLVPLDTHMLSIARHCGLTRCRQASLKASREITAAFREIAADDPVRYDFSLTRLGIHPDLNKGRFFRTEDFTARGNFATF